MRKGFTLVELSIVLVILGLLVGGVLSGQSLIRAAELRSIGTEKDKIVTALNAFRDKYMGLPGDLANAHAFWGDTCGDNDAQPSTGCNGNGNGFIEPYSKADNTTGLGENKKAWEHLSRAGLIEGSYDGTGTLLADNWVAHSAANTLKARYPETYWNLTYDYGDIASEGNVSFDALYLEFGTITPDNDYGGELNMVPSLSNGDAWNIDKKLDDGRSRTGRVRGDNRADCDDAGGTDAYSLVQTGADTMGQCMFHMILR